MVALFLPAEERLDPSKASFTWRKLVLCTRVTHTSQIFLRFLTTLIGACASAVVSSWLLLARAKGSPFYTDNCSLNFTRLGRCGGGGWPSSTGSFFFSIKLGLASRRKQLIFADATTPPRSGWCFWLVVPRGIFSSTSMKRLPVFG